MCRRTLLTFVLVFLGCAPNHPRATTQPLDREISAATYLATVQAQVAPPIGWKPDPLKHSPQHAHQVWIGPSGHTAYGVIHFGLPLPVGHDLALFGFLQYMKVSEGESNLISKNWDANLGCLRFVAEGGIYRVRVNLFVNGFEGWAIYAGTLRRFPVNSDELVLAERARELTVVGH